MAEKLRSHIWKTTTPHDMGGFWALSLVSRKDFRQISQKERAVADHLASLLLGKLRFDHELITVHGHIVRFYHAAALTPLAREFH